MNIQKDNNELSPYESSEITTSIVPVGSIVGASDGNATSIAIVTKDLVKVDGTIG